MADVATGDDLFAIAAGGWGYTESAWIDGWQLRAGGGFTRRANSAWPIGPLSRPLPEAVAAVRDWYAARGLPALINVVTGAELDLALERLGYPAQHGALRQTAVVSDVLDLLADVAPIDVKEIFDDAPDERWLRLYRAGTLPPAAREILGSGERVRYATVYDPDTGAALSIGRAALAVRPGDVGPADWLALAGIETAPAARRRGLAKLVTDGLLEWASDRDATHVYLEVGDDNAPALELYESLGFTTDHAYHYRVIG
jgi:ribosomal protein S18 acetylase RimI-like enzyme